MKKTILLSIILLISASCMVKIPKKQTAAQPQTHIIDFGERNYAFFDEKTGEPSTGIYAAGESVVLSFPFVATDTRYKFYIDGEEISSDDYDPKKGLIFRFVMPDHDIKFTWESENIMIKIE